jgi:hypothetical protein
MGLRLHSNNLHSIYSMAYHFQYQFFIIKSWETLGNLIGSTKKSIVAICKGNYKY